MIKRQVLDLDLSALKRICENVDPSSHSWARGNLENDALCEHDGKGLVLMRKTSPPNRLDDTDFDFIATFNANTVMSLINEIELLRAVNEEIKRDRARLDAKCGRLSAMKEPQTEVRTIDGMSAEEEIVVLHDNSEWVRRERFVKCANALVKCILGE